MNFYTYILFAEKLDKFYIGHTNDLERRVNENNSGFSKSTKMKSLGSWFTQNFLFLNLRLMLLREKLNQ